MQTCVLSDGMVSWKYGLSLWCALAAAVALVVAVTIAVAISIAVSISIARNRSSRGNIGQNWLECLACISELTCLAGSL